MQTVIVQNFTECLFSQAKSIFFFLYKPMNHEIIRNESFYGVCITKINFMLGILQTISKCLDQKNISSRIEAKEPIIIMYDNYQNNSKRNS